jgi:hypothetical protein
LDAVQKQNKKMNTPFKMKNSALAKMAKTAGSPLNNKYIKALKEASKGSNLTTAIQRAQVSLDESRKQEKKKK